MSLVPGKRTRMPSAIRLSVHVGPARDQSAPSEQSVSARRPSKLLRFPGNPVAIPYQKYKNASGRYYMLSYYQDGGPRTGICADRKAAGAAPRLFAAFGGALTATPPMSKPDLSPMHYILLSVPPPEASAGDAASKWETLVRILAEKARTTKGVVVLGPSSWLLERDPGLPFAAEGLVLAQRNNLAHKVWFLDQS